MKRKLLLTFSLLLASFCLLMAQSQYRSLGTGVTVDLGSATNWQVSTDAGATWNAATAAPTGLASGSTILIQAGDTWANAIGATTIPAGVTLTNNSILLGTFTAGKLTVGGTLVYSGAAAQNLPASASFVSSTIANLTINNTATPSTSATVTMGTGSITVSGVITLTAGQLICNTGGGTLFVKGSIVGTGGLLKSTGYFSLSGSAGQVIPGALLVNNTLGLLNVAGGGTVNNYSSTGPLIISSAININTGAFTLGGPLTINGTTLTATATSGGITSGSNAVTFKGTAAQNIPALFFTGNTVNNLVLSNSTTGVTSATSLNIGGYTVSPLKVGVTPLTVTGTASISGALTISTFAATPTSGQVFTILAGTAVSGTFSSLSLPSGYTGTLAYSGTDVKLTVTPIPSSNASLSALTSTAGSLTPTFNSSTTSYTATVPNTTTSVTVTPTAQVASSTIKVNGTTLASGNTSAAINLNVGNNTITIAVTAQDGVTTKTYTLNVTRLSNVYTFDTGVPSNFTATGSTLTSSTSHIKSGNSLAWSVTNGAVLTASSLGITSAQTGSFTASAAQFYVYSPVASQDTLIFSFYTNGNSTPQRVGHMLLNFAGWRDYHRSYRFDYNNGQDIGSGFALDKMTITYKAANGSSTPTIYLDEFNMVGDVVNRMPGPHMVLDFSQFSKGYSNLEPLEYFQFNPPAGPAPTATGQEQTDAVTIKSKYGRSIPTVSGTNVTTAENYVASCGIGRNVDGSITGTRGLLYLDNVDTLVKIGNYVGYLTQAAVKNNDNVAKSNLLLFTEYLLDQGLAEGGRNYIATNDYTNAQTFPVGFLQAVKSGLLTDTLNKGVLKMLKWSNGYNSIYNTTSTWLPAPMFTDFIYLKTTFLLELAGYTTSVDEQVRDYYATSNLLSVFTTTQQGAEDGIKPDGTFFHHEFNNVPYLYTWGAYADRANSLKGTVFRIKQYAFDNMSRSFKTAYLQQSPNAELVPNSLSGRHPFTGFTEISSSKLQEMVAVGGDLKGTSMDTDLAQFYNYIYQTNFYSVPAKNYDSVYHYNYAQYGVKRKGNWIAAMKGFTNVLLGSEIYASQNRYGRYQSYGALEILYKGGNKANGWLADGDGWDWNVYPGTTNVQLPWTSLQPTGNVTVFDNQANSFVGALSLGDKHGIFAMDFLEKTTGGYTVNNGLKFKKSVFVFDNLMVCLGTSISATNSAGITSTNLFQAIDTAANFAPIYVNNATAINGATYNNTLSTSANSAWMVNGQTTGYYIPKNGGTITVARGSQTTPDETDYNQTKFNTANYSKAYISHGNAPTNATYQFVVVPGTTPADMQTLAAALDTGGVYSVLRQTDSLHVVTYKPDSLTSYAFFSPNNNVNIGYVKSISNKALLGIKKSKDTLVVTINNPDLNTVTDGSSVVEKWHSTPQNINLVLNGNWTVVANNTGASVSTSNNTLTAGFTLKDGFSGSLTLVASKPPVVKLISPAQDTTVATGANLVINANAGSPNQGGSIAKVDFYNGSTLLGTSTTAPFSYTWNNLTAGTDTLKAVATDNIGLTNTSSKVVVTVSNPPVIAMTAPMNDSTVTAGDNIILTADASSPNTGGSVAKVDFYNGSALVGTATAAPFSYTWNSVTAGIDTLKAVATDHNGFTTTSASIRLMVNQPPTVAVTSPVANTSYFAPASITINANAADADGSVQKVEFFQGATKLGEALDAPYSFSWTNVPAGNYAITAKATDNNNAVTTSAVVNSTVATRPVLQVNIPDMYALNAATDIKNTIYIGYGPSSFTLTPSVQGGQGGYTYSWSNGATASSIVVSTAGTYTVNVSSADGGLGSATIAISTLDVRCGVDNTKVQVCHNQHIICVAQSAVQAHLDHGDNLGACNGSMADAHANTNSLTNDLTALVSTSNIAVYPNPVADILYIAVPQVAMGATIHLYSYSSPGKEVRTFNLTQPKQDVTFQGLAPGYYFLVIKNGSQIIKKTLIKN